MIMGPQGKYAVPKHYTALCTLEHGEKRRRDEKAWIHTHKSSGDDRNVNQSQKAPQCLPREGRRRAQQ